MRGDATARERHQRTGVCVVYGNMRSSLRGADDTRSPRLAAVEDFDVDVLARHAEGCERLLHLRHEATRPAKVNVGLPGDADLVEDRSRQVAGRVEILADPVARVRSTVANVAASVREREHEAPDFDSEWMMLTVPSRVQPQDLSCRASCGQRVQHPENRRRADSRAEQDDRSLPRLQNEAP